MNAYQGLVRPLRVVIMSSYSSMVSPIASICSLNSDILEKYSWIVSPFYILVLLS
jgi:hypothetical protein